MNKKTFLADTLAQMSTDVDGKPLSKMEYLSAEESKHAIPKGRRIRKDLRWDSRFRNYLAGPRPPVMADVVNLSGEVYWYDHAEDVVKQLSREAVLSAAPDKPLWVKPSTVVPKIAFDAEDHTMVGYVEDEPRSVQKAGNLSTFLADDDEI
jgi:hypothetical protein